MNSITRIALMTAAGTILSSAAAIADNQQVHIGPYGQGGPITYSKPAPRKTTVALYSNGRAVGNTAKVEREPQEPRWENVGGYANGGAISFYTGAR